jgi:Arc/MetJ-type ribon-helix-helix transcriptional regulator
MGGGGGKRFASGELQFAIGVRAVWGGANGIIVNEVNMVVSLRPELQKLVEEKVKAGLFPSAEALINAAVEQVVSGDDLDPGEMERLLATGETHARAGRFVDGPKAFAKINAKSKARRKGK